MKCSDPPPLCCSQFLAVASNLGNARPVGANPSHHPPPPSTTSFPNFPFSNLRYLFFCEIKRATQNPHNHSRDHSTRLIALTNQNNTKPKNHRIPFPPGQSCLIPSSADELEIMASPPRPPKTKQVPTVTSKPVASRTYRCEGVRLASSRLWPTMPSTLGPPVPLPPPFPLPRAPFSPVLDNGPGLLLSLAWPGSTGAWGSPRCDLTRAARRTPPLSGEPPFSHEVSEAQQHLNLQLSDNVFNHRPRLICHHPIHHKRLHFHPLHFVPPISRPSDLHSLLFVVLCFFFLLLSSTNPLTIPRLLCPRHPSKWVMKMPSTWPSSPSRPSATKVCCVYTHTHTRLCAMAPGPQSN